MSEENVEVVRQVLEHWARGDLTFADSFDPEIEFSRTGGEVDGVALEGRYRGLEAMWAATVEWLRGFDDLRVESERVIELADDRALALCRHRAGQSERSADQPRTGLRVHAARPQDHWLGPLLGPRRSPRSRRAVGVGDVGGEPWRSFATADKSVVSADAA